MIYRADDSNLREHPLTCCLQNLHLQLWKLLQENISLLQLRLTKACFSDIGILLTELLVLTTHLKMNVLYFLAASNEFFGFKQLQNITTLTVVSFMILH